MEDIIELLERRSEQGLALLKEKYADECYRIIYGLLRDHSLAEEALSDVWMQIWNSIPPAKPRHLRAYLAKTARNTALHHLQHETAQKRSGVTVLLDELAQCIPDPSTQGENRELKELLRDFVGSLPQEEKRIFLRRYWYGDTIEELTAQFQSSESRITGILFRTRKKLKKYLQKEGYHL